MLSLNLAGIACFAYMSVLVMKYLCYSISSVVLAVLHDSLGPQLSPVKFVRHFNSVM